MKKLDYKKMLQEIDELVQTDFCMDMDSRLIRKRPLFTKRESVEMAILIGRIYSISHCISCSACNKKYL